MANNIDTIRNLNNEELSVLLNKSVELLKNQYLLLSKDIAQRVQISPASLSKMRRNHHAQLVPNRRLIEVILKISEEFKLDFEKVNGKVQVSSSSKSINIFISYSRKDKSYVEDLRAHLAIFQRRYNVQIWYDGMITPGEVWETSIKKALDKADIILLLISTDFLSSQFIYEVELKKVLERHERNNVSVIPIIARSCFWQDTPIAKFQALPSGAKPISGYSNQDEAYIEIARGIQSAIEEKIVGSEKEQIEIPSKEIRSKLKLEDVFVTNGTPTFTFVEPEDFPYLQLALRQHGKGIVIEGPSGIGKTSTAINLLLSANLPYKYFSARVESDVAEIKDIKGLKGIIIIDDFHRLDSELKNRIANHLKYLADCGATDTKLIIIGIPNTGDSLIKLSFDLANRISIFKLGNVNEDTILSMIEKGEEALNIEFKQKVGIVREAFGSLQIAQLLCQYTAGTNKIFETQESKVKIKSGVYEVMKRLIKDLSPKYDELMKNFAAIGGRRDRTCIKILKELASCDNGVLQLHYLKARKPELKEGIQKLMLRKSFSNFFSEFPEGRRHLLFDKNIPALIIDDPQFKFYLNNCSYDHLEIATGKLPDAERNKVFISYSHADEVWLKMVLLHLKHLEKKGLIDLWVDERINAGQNWRKEINEALNKTKVAILLLSQEFLASDFIIDNEVPPILKAVEEDDAKVLQVFLRPCSINNFPELNQFQMINSPQKPLAGLSQVGQDTVLVELAETVNKYINEE